MFALDTSNIVTEADLKQMTEFIMANLDQYLPSSKLSLLRFGSKAVIDTPLTQDRRFIESKLKSMERISGGRRIDLALSKIEKDIFSDSLNSINQPVRQVVLLTTGSNDPLRSVMLSNVVKDLKKFMKVNFIYVGLGGPNMAKEDGELISSNSASLLNIFPTQLPSIYDDLDEVISRNAGKICFCWLLFKIAQKSFPKAFYRKRKICVKGPFTLQN